MSPNLPFHLYVNQLKQKYPSFHRCQNVLKQNSVFYRCNTCCLTPGGCLCENCFRNGNHEVGVCLSPHAQGHDVSMEYCYATGVCDCGDENVIRESGWCQLHRSTKNTPLPTEMDAAYSFMYPIPPSDASHFQPAIFAALTLLTFFLPTLFLPGYRDLVSSSTRK